MWSQSFFDTSIGGGVVDKEPFGSIELRYSTPSLLISKVWISPSVRFDLNGFDYQLNPLFSIGATTSPKDWMMVTAGIISKDTWYEYFLRTDIKIIETDEGWIGGVLNVKEDKILFGITFKDFIIR